MDKTFYKIKFEEISEINYETFIEINDIVTENRKTGHGKICAPRKEYYDENSDIANPLGMKMYITLYFHENGEMKLKQEIETDLEKIGLKPCFELRSPQFIEIFYKTENIENLKQFKEDLRLKIKKTGGEIRNRNYKDGYDNSINFRPFWQMHNFEEKINEILNFIREYVNEDYFIEYY